MKEQRDLLEVPENRQSLSPIKISSCIFPVAWEPDGAAGRRGKSPVIVSHRNHFLQPEDGAWGPVLVSLVSLLVTWEPDGGAGNCGKSLILVISHHDFLWLRNQSVVPGGKSSRQSLSRIITLSCLSSSNISCCICSLGGGSQPPRCNGRRLLHQPDRPAPAQTLPPPSPPRGFCGPLLLSRAAFAARP